MWSQYISRFITVRFNYFRGFPDASLSTFHQQKEDEDCVMNSVLWTWQIRFPNIRVTTTCAISQKAGLDFIAIWRNVFACSKHFRHLLRLINWWTNLLRFNCDMFRQCFNFGGVGVSWGCITCSCHIKMTLLLSHQHQLKWVVRRPFFP